MSNLIITVMAIALAALLAVGGINYVHTDAGLRLETLSSLRAQHDTILSGISSYRIANNGYTPTDIGQLKGFIAKDGIPMFPRNLKPFSWKIHDGHLCIEKNVGEKVPSGAYDALVSFAQQQASKSPDEVKFGIACSGAISGTLVNDGGFDEEFLIPEVPAALILKAI